MKYTRPRTKTQDKILYKILQECNEILIKYKIKEKNYYLTKHNTTLELKINL